MGKKAEGPPRPFEASVPRGFPQGHGVKKAPYLGRSGDPKKEGAGNRLFRRARAPVLEEEEYP